MHRRLISLVVAAIAAATIVAGAGADSSAPASLATKNVRMDVNLHDAEGLVFDATLWQIAPATPPAIRDFLNQRLDYSFELDASAAKCFLVLNEVAGALDCKELAARIDASAAGGVDATVLARTVVATDGTVSFKAKKITVWQSHAADDEHPGDAKPPAVPPKFFSKSHRLNVTLNDVEQTTFDASLADFPGQTPARVQEYIGWNVEASFNLDASAAVCFTVKRDTVTAIDCKEIAAHVDSSVDPVYASILAKPYLDADGDLAFKAKKITIWL
jgi:hypothetical protein